MLKRLGVVLTLECGCGRTCQISSAMGAAAACQCGTWFRVTCQSRTMTDTKSVGSFVVEVVTAVGGK